MVIALITFVRPIVASAESVDLGLFKADNSTESFLDVVERTETDAYRKDLEDEKIELDY